MSQITNEDFPIEKVLLNLKNKNVGAIVSFLGVVRGFSEGIETNQLEFQVYREVAQKKLDEIRVNATKRFQISDVAIIHRLGKLVVSDNIVLIAVSAAHRDNAFKACRSILEDLKREVPIWKKEFSSQGTYWKGEDVIEDHLDPIKMVNVSEKPIVHRSAIAIGNLWLSPTTIAAIQGKNIKKGDVFSTAEIAGILAAKKTWELIPLCHQIPLSEVSLKFDISSTYITVSCQVYANYKTGVEMEALVGATTALLTIWDMVKYLEKDEQGEYPTARIDNIRIIEKKKGEQ